jgi:predicted nucleic acid-binding protein
LKAFIDTGFFCALANARDRFNPEAVNIIKDFLSQGIQSYTSNFVLSETYTLIRIRTNHALAAKFLKQFPKSGVITIRPTESVEESAKSIFLKYADKDFSFVDCLSFAIIEDEKIDYALSFDHHFKLYHFAHQIKILP